MTFMIIFPAETVLLSFFLTVLEFVSAIGRLLKGGTISDEEFRNTLSTFSQEVEPFLIRSVDDKIVADALTYVTKHGLKPADSIQLATVIELRDERSWRKSDFCL